MLADGANTNEFHIACQHINYHRQLIKEVLSHASAEGRNADSRAEFAGVFEAILLVDIRLQVFRIGVHCAEFIYLKLASVFPYPIESNEQTIELGGYRLRTETPSGNHIAEVAHFMVIHNFKTAIAQSSKHLRTRENAVFALGNIKIQARGHHQTREDAFVKIYKCKFSKGGY